MATRRSNLKAVPDRKARTAPDMRAAVEDAVAAMSWLEDSDQAMVATARALADQIETAIELSAEYDALAADLAAAGEDALLKRLRSFEKRADMQKVVGWFAPMLQGVLRDLGGAPLSRKLMAEEAAPGERLAAIRAMVAPSRAGGRP